MNPLELEVYHQIKNIVGDLVDCQLIVSSLRTYRTDTYLFTFTNSFALSSMVHDKKVLGVCGETSLANSKQSMITIMQDHERYILRRLAKVFESLFSLVT